MCQGINAAAGLVHMLFNYLGNGDSYLWLARGLHSGIFYFIPPPPQVLIFSQYPYGLSRP